MIHSSTFRSQSPTFIITFLITFVILFSVQLHASSRAHVMEPPSSQTCRSTLSNENCGAQALFIVKSVLYEINNMLFSVEAEDSLLVV